MSKVNKRPKWHWNCAGSLCTNSWRSSIPGLTFYYLREVKDRTELRPAYQKVLKNEGVNWKKAVICSQHWSSGKRTSIEDKPDMACTPEYLRCIEKSKSKKKKRHLVAAKKSIDKQTSVKEKKRRVLVRKPPPSPEPPPPTVEDELRAKLQEKEEEINNLKDQISVLTKCQEDNKKLSDKIKSDLLKGQFDYIQTSKHPARFFELTGLMVNEFDCLFECAKPYMHLILYPDCSLKVNNTSRERCLSKQTELMCFLCICRHSLHLSVAAWMTQVNSTFKQNHPLPPIKVVIWLLHH